MCGIVGGTNKAWDIESAVFSLRHRGPDSQKTVSNQDLVMGFARLAIIDLSHDADQPMSTDDKKIWIVFNGEVYAYKELRKDLISLGYRFRSQSDTEVILHAYEEWGDDFVQHIDGMFAIAIHDLRTRQLKIFRDRAGIKPLYYYHYNGQFAFASELKGIEALCRDVAFEYDYTGLYDYLTYYYIPDPKTLYKNVFKLPPAHQLTYDLVANKIIKLNRYWELRVDPVGKSWTVDEASEQLREFIKESVRDQLVADVPVGCFLSGGMDSSVIVAEASELKADLETFSIGFDNDEITETKYAREVAQKFSVNHHIRILSQSSADDLFKSIKQWYDEPFADISALPTFLVSKFAREKMKVVLTGDGGDEVFGGYSRFHRFNMINKIPHFPNETLRNMFTNLKLNVRPFSILHKFAYGMELLTADEISCYGVLMDAMTPFEKIQYAKDWGIPKDYDTYWYFRKYYRKDLPLLTRLQYLDFHTYLPSDILTKVDRVSMAVSLEARVPLLSRKIIEFVFSLPEDIRYCDNRLKGLIKKAYQEKLPHSIIERAKMGFGVPDRYLNRRSERIQKKILREVFKVT